MTIFVGDAYHKFIVVAGPLHDNGKECYNVARQSDASVITMMKIPEWKEHREILVSDNEMFCTRCSESVFTNETDFPYIRMLYQMPEECDDEDNIF